MKPPGPESKRTLLGYGAIPQPLASDKDTEPNLFGNSAESFEAPAADEATAPRCYMCGKSTWDYDDGFEAGIAYALTQTQGLLSSGMAGQRLEPAEAAALVDWMRLQIQPNKPK